MAAPSRYGAVANQQCNPVVVPELPVGRHNVAVRAVCPGFPPVFSEPANASWTVVDGRPTNTSILGPVLTNDPSPTFTLGANKGDCSYNFSLDDGPAQTQEAATTGSLTAQWLGEIPAVWPHSRGTIAFSSSMGIGTKFVVKMDGQHVDTVVARGGAEAHLELVNIEEGHTRSVLLPRQTESPTRSPVPSKWGRRLTRSSSEGQ